MLFSWANNVKLKVNPLKKHHNLRTIPTESKFEG